MKTNITSHPRFYLMMVLLLLALAACGGGGETPAEAEIAPTTAAAADAATAEQPAAVVPTDAPTVEPTAPPATAEPTAQATAEPDNPPAAAFGTGDCGNAFYPVVEGRALTFRSNVMGLGETSYTTIYSDVSDSSFTNTTDLGDGQMMVQTWQCTGEGMLSPEFTQMPGGLEGIEIEFTEASGVSIPSEDTLRNGGSWTTHYVATANLPDMGAGAMTMQQTIDLANTVVGTEAVTVPAGDFPDAIRVDTVGTMSMIMSTGDTAQPATEITMSYTSWYVEGVGVVRQDFSGLFGDTGAGNNLTELVSVD